MNIYGLAIIEDELLVSGDNNVYNTSLPINKFSRFKSMNFQINLPWVWNLEVSNQGYVGGHDRTGFYWFRKNDSDLQQINISELDDWKEMENYDHTLSGFEFSQDGDKVYLFSSVIHELDLRTRKSQLLPNDLNLNRSAQLITDLIEDENDNLWIAGAEFLGKFKKENNHIVLSERYTVKDGLASTEVHEIFEDKSGRIWLFTSSGMNCIDPLSQ